MAAPATAAIAAAMPEAPDVVSDEGRGEVLGVVPGRYVGADDWEGDDEIAAARPGWTPGLGDADAFESADAGISPSVPL